MSSAAPPRTHTPEGLSSRALLCEPVAACMKLSLIALLAGYHAAGATVAGGGAVAAHSGHS